MPGHSPLRDLLNAGVACRTTSPAARPMAPLVALVLDHLGITLDDTAVAGSWPSLTFSEDDAPSTPRGKTYAGEGPVLPQSPTGN
ncbi:hypothetical protein ACRJ4B_15200 [Streptomyces sp. GTA36]